MLPIDKIFQILNFIRPVLDIAVISFIFYKVYQVIIKTSGMQLAKAALMILLAFMVAKALNLETLLWVMTIIAPGLFVCFAIVFQPEIRKIFLKLGQKEWFTFGNRSKHTYVDSVLIAAEMLSKQRRGMLACFLRHNKVPEIVDTGTKVNADLSSNLLITIFGHDTPLHDGACFIQGGKLVAAGCFLPSSEQYDIKKTFGTRHRAALGLSEVSDAVTVVVSEETGAISLAYDSHLHYDLSIPELTNTLEHLLQITAGDKIIEDTIDESKNYH